MVHFIPALAPSMCCKRGRLLIITNISCFKGILMNLSATLEQHLKGNTVPGIISACVSPATKPLIARTGHQSWLIQSSVPALPKSNGRIEKSSDTRKDSSYSLSCHFCKKKNSQQNAGEIHILPKSEKSLSLCNIKPCFNCGIRLLYL